MFQKAKYVIPAIHCHNPYSLLSVHPAFSIILSLEKLSLEEQFI